MADDPTVDPGADPAVDAPVDRATATPDGAEAAGAETASTEIAGTETGAPDAALRAVRDAVLLATLDNVPFDGWTEKALDEARAQVAETAPPDLLARAFPGGIADVPAHLQDWTDRQMRLRLAEWPEFGTARTRDKVAMGVRARLEVLTPYKDVMRRLVSVLGMPPRSGSGAGRVFQAADAIWTAAGDTSTDYNWYTKRALLTGVIMATFFFWLDDTSEDQSQTWAFLDRRIDNALTLGKVAGPRIKPIAPVIERVVRGFGRGPFGRPG